MKQARGFTLLEALVALTLLGLLAALVFPNMQRWYQGQLVRQALAQVRGQLQQMGAVAVSSGRDLSLNDVAGPQATVAAPHRLQLPPGWALMDAGDVRFLRTGLCQGGSARFQAGAQSIAIHLRNERCDLELTVAEGAP